MEHNDQTTGFRSRIYPGPPLPTPASCFPQCSSSQVVYIYIYILIRQVEELFVTFNSVLSFDTTDYMASTTEMYFLTPLEPGSPRSRCWQGWFPLRSLSLTCRRLPTRYVFTWWPSAYSHHWSLLMDLNFLFL